MSAPATSSVASEFPVLLRGEAGPLAAWAHTWQTRRVAFHVAIIVLGAGLYGAAMGCWRGPQQALYVAIKFPLILLLTTLGNALLNSMLAPLLGLNISFRQTLLAILMSFAIASAILGAFSPLAVFVVWNAPPMTPEAQLDSAVYSFIKVLNVSVIAYAGIAANLRLKQWLANFGGGPAAARRVMWAWLAGNLLFGSQLAWILRPFIGSPLLPIEFVRADALDSNFFENVYLSLRQMLGA